MRFTTARWLPTTVLGLFRLVGSTVAGEESAPGTRTYLLQARMTQIETSWQPAGFTFQLKNLGSKEMQGCLGPSYGWEFEGRGDEGRLR